MRISFERSGGFAGNITFTAEVDTKSCLVTRGASRAARQLSPDEAQSLEELVQKIDFTRARSFRTGTQRGADQFQYSLTVETDDGQRRALHLGESSASGPLLDLIAQLAKLSKER